MEKQQVEPLRQINTSLPVGLVKFLERQAAQSDRTLSGFIRHVLSEFDRLEPPPPPKPFGVVLPNVGADAKSIDEARSLVAGWQQERAAIARRSRGFGGSSAADDAHAEVLRGQIEIVENQIRIALQHMPSNGGRAHAR